MYASAYETATRRHWRSAEKLYKYHFGFAAECAVKHALDRRFLVGPAPYAHFAEGEPNDLRAMALRRLQGRRAVSLVAVLRNDQFLKNWHISMRYAVDGTVDEARCAAWRRNAQGVMAAIEIRT